MKLSSAQHRILSTYHRLRGTQPTIPSLLAPVWWRYLLAVILAATAVLILPTALTFLFAGFVLGMIVRDLSRYRDLARQWPLYETILAWEEIEALLADDR